MTDWPKLEISVDTPSGARKEWSRFRLAPESRSASVCWHMPLTTQQQRSALLSSWQRLPSETRLRVTTRRALHSTRVSTKVSEVVGQSEGVRRKISLNLFEAIKRRSISPGVEPATTQTPLLKHVCSLIPENFLFSLGFFFFMFTHTRVSGMMAVNPSSLCSAWMEEPVLAGNPGWGGSGDQEILLTR